MTMPIAQGRDGTAAHPSNSTPSTNTNSSFQVSENETHNTTGVPPTSATSFVDNNAARTNATALTPQSLSALQSYPESSPMGIGMLSAPSTMQSNYQANNNSSSNNSHEGVIDSSSPAPAPNSYGRLYLVVGPEQQQATISFTTDMRDALLRGYQENGVDAFSQEFSTLDQVQEVLEDMEIVPPASSLIVADLASAEEDEGHEEIKAAREQLRAARQKLREAEQHLKNTKQRLGVGMVTPQASAAAPFPNQPTPISQVPPKPVYQSQHQSTTPTMTTSPTKVSNGTIPQLPPMPGTAKTPMPPKSLAQTYPHSAPPKSMPSSTAMAPMNQSCQTLSPNTSATAQQQQTDGDMTAPPPTAPAIRGSSLSTLADAANSAPFRQISDLNTATGSTSATSSTSYTNSKKRPYNTSEETVVRKGNRWLVMYKELKEYKRVYGNCVVPRSFADNPRLASWVAEQRKQYRLKCNNKPTNITDERIKLLNDLGFTWHAQSAAWNRHLNDLRNYKKENGDCMVPLNHDKYPQLGLWVKEQRRHRSLMLRGRHSHMTEERVKILESVGFCWDSHEAAWWDKYRELKDYNEEFGDCMVPHRYAPNPQLSTWVHQQKRQIRLLKEGKMSHMNEGRADALMKLGFEYRHRKKRRKSSVVLLPNADAMGGLQQQGQTAVTTQEEDDDENSSSDTESDEESGDESEGETELRKSVVNSFVASDAFQLRKPMEANL